MVTPLAMGGMMVGADLIGGMINRSQARKEQSRMQDFWSNQLQQRQNGEIGSALKGLYSEQMAELGKMPGYLKRSREGRLASASAERRKRFQRNLARSGATRASSAGMLGSEQMERGIDQTAQQGELQEQQALFGMRGQQMGLGQNMLNAMYGSPSQAIQGQAQNMQSIEYNPMSAVNSGFMGYAMGDQMETNASTRALNKSKIK